MDARPNILFIMTDQMRADSWGPSTPNIAGLAAPGVAFRNCVTNSPICAPARASLLAGLYPHQLGVWDNGPHTFPARAENWVRVLRDAGYRTSVIGKTHYYPYNGSVPDMRLAEPLLHEYGYQDVDEIPGPRVSGTLMSHMTAAWRNLGYLEKVREDLASRYSGNHAVSRESALPLEWYPDVYVGRKAEEYLANYDRDQPFFCFVSFGGPHDPWDCPREYLSRFENYPVPEPLPAFLDANPRRPRGTWDKPVDYPPFSRADVMAIRRNYAGKVSLIDDQVGRILRALERAGRLENTVVVFSSDHGEMNGDHGRLYKSNFLESALKVPLIVQAPGCRHAETDELVELLDIGPTILAFAGLKPEYAQVGISFADLVFGEGASSGRDFVISEYDREIMVFDGRWKMVVNREGEPYLLFDLLDDPDEQRNLAADVVHADQETRLLGLLAGIPGVAGIPGISDAAGGLTSSG